MDEVTKLHELDVDLGGGGAETKHASSDYGAKDIQILEGLEAVRMRPGMYIGDQGPRGLHHLVYEVVDNAIDEALAGFCTEVDVSVNADGSVTVSDNGRGIPTDMHPTAGRPAAEVVMTVLHAGGKFDKGAYQVSGGLHGVGVSVVNALSVWLDLRICHEGSEFKQRYQRGVPVGPLVRTGDSSERGTTVTFMPDHEIFSTTIFSSDTLKGRLRELAFLNPGVVINFADKRPDDTGAISQPKSFCYEGGLRSFVEYLNRGREVAFKPPVFIKGSRDNVTVEVALQYNDSFNERVFAFANLINTVEGGTHVTGFRSALTRAINDEARREKLLKEKEENLSGDDLKEGLTAVISVKLLEPQFEGQTKTKLGNGEVKGIADSIVYEGLKIALEETPEILKPIVDKALKARAARDAARKARDLVRRKSAMSSLDLPSKLADCSSKDSQKTELYIVEGDSAGGSAKQGRDRNFQAVLPLRGKILNVEKARLDKVLANEVIRTIIQALGCGIGDEYDEKKLRYGKIFLMADADVDGAHIRTLLLTLFYRFMPQIIENDHLFVAQPPLYRVQEGKKIHYCYSEEEMKRISETMDPKRTHVQRYKGLGEMNPEQLWETTMDPNNRVTLRVDVNDPVIADDLFGVLMGDDVLPRREFIETHAKSVRNLDI